MEHELSKHYILAKVMMSVHNNTNAAIKWRVENESPARLQFEKETHNQHIDYQFVHSSRVIVHRQLKVSPGGFMNCKYHGKRLIEVKCHDRPVEAIVNKSTLDNSPPPNYDKESKDECHHVNNNPRYKWYVK